MQKLGAGEVSFLSHGGGFGGDQQTVCVWESPSLYLFVLCGFMDFQYQENLLSLLERLEFQLSSLTGMFSFPRPLKTL